MPGSVNPGSVRQSDPVLRNQQEGESLLQEEGRRRQAAAGNPDHLLRSNVTQAAASASANNSPFRSARNSPEPRPAGESEDVDTQPPQMSTSDITAFTASLQVAHDAAEAQRVEAVGPRHRYPQVFPGGGGGWFPVQLQGMFQPAERLWAEGFRPGDLTAESGITDWH